MNETREVSGSTVCVFPFQPQPITGVCKSAAELFGWHWDVEIYTYTCYLAFLMAGFTRAWMRNLRGDLRVLVRGMVCGIACVVSAGVSRTSYQCTLYARSTCVVSNAVCRNARCAPDKDAR
jgi:hypothetical protein